MPDRAIPRKGRGDPQNEIGSSLTAQVGAKLCNSICEVIPRVHRVTTNFFKRSLRSIPHGSKSAHLS